MRVYRVKRGKPVWLDSDAEVLITKIIADIVKEKNYNVKAYNVCKDHIHMLLQCQQSGMSNIVRLLKGKSAQCYKEFLKIPANVKFHLWAQKFNWWLITSLKQYHNTKAYIERNREKHGYAENKQLQSLVKSMIKIEDSAR